MKKTIEQQIIEGYEAGWLMTYDQWWEKVKDAFTYVDNKLNPMALYIDYVIDTLN